MRRDWQPQDRTKLRRFMQIKVPFRLLILLLFCTRNLITRRLQAYSVTATALSLSKFSPTFGPRAGVTSLLPIQHHGVVVGDKRGTIRLESLDLLDESLRPAAECFCKQNINGITERSVPVFCLDAASSNLIFSGAGDRYVSIWKKENGNWFCNEKLGPHTGWVRDVLFDKSHNVLHSIGCNCVETWQLSDEDGKWHHLRKSSIESSPKEGATLSSDILCLCKFDEVYLLSGGVDGRVLVWDSPSMGTPLRSFTAHQGRVNAMEHAEESSFVFTAGNDGKIKCWTCISEDGKFDVVDEFVMGESRVTSLCAIYVKGKDRILCGTNEGEVALLSLQKDGSSLKLETIIQLRQTPIVHAICISGQEEPHVWIGHSEGLAIFSLSSFTDLS